MSAHLSASQLERYRLRGMPHGDLLAADDHLFACAACRHRLGGAAEARVALSELRESLRRTALADEHPAYELFAAYADGELDAHGRAALEGHARACAHCATELRELLTFKDELDAHAFAAARPQPGVRASSPARRGALESLLAIFRGQSAWALSPGWAVAAVVLLAVAFTWWLVAGTPDGAGGEVARNAPASPSSPPPSVAPAASVVRKATPGDGVARAVPTERGAESRDDIVSATKTGERDATLADSRAAEAPSNAPRVVAALDDGGRRVALDGAGALKGLESLPREQREQVRRALATRKLASPALAEVRSEARTLMGAGVAAESFGVSGPAGVVVRDDRPVLRWRPLEGADGYTVRVFDEDFREVAASPSISTVEWRPERPLARGRVYTWQVKAARGGAELLAPAANEPSARFKVLARAQADELGRAEKSSPRSPLALGVLYARAGLLEEAERELRRLAGANPRSAHARAMLREVRALRGAR